MFSKINMHCVHVLSSIIHSSMFSLWGSKNTLYWCTIQLELHTHRVILHASHSLFSFCFPIHSFFLHFSSFTPACHPYIYSPHSPPPPFPMLAFSFISYNTYLFIYFLIKLVITYSSPISVQEAILVLWDHHWTIHMYNKIMSANTEQACICKFWIILLCLASPPISRSLTICFLLILRFSPFRYTCINDFQFPLPFPFFSTTFSSPSVSPLHS